MQRKVDDLPRSIESATRSLRSECDARVQEERRKIAKIEQRCQDDCDKLKDELSGQIRRIQAECDEKISDYEEKLEIAHGNEKHTAMTRTFAKTTKIVQKPSDFGSFFGTGKCS